ncbi:MAG: DUF1499 domain-containing protein [Ruegeria sp.]
MIIFWLLIVPVIVVGGYIRLAPSDPVRWHVAPRGDADRDMKNGVLRVIQTGPGGLQRLDGIAQNAPRTSVLVGSVDEGMITFVTRTRIVGYPDYTTALQDGDTLRIYARSRFGRSDYGVNKQRVDGWLGALQP